jgi:hypothetical protein
MTIIQCHTILHSYSYIVYVMIHSAPIQQLTYYNRIHVDDYFKKDVDRAV